MNATRAERRRAERERKRIEKLGLPKPAPTTQKPSRRRHPAMTAALAEAIMAAADATWRR